MQTNKRSWQPPTRKKLNAAMVSLGVPMLPAIFSIVIGHHSFTTKVNQLLFFTTIIAFLFILLLGLMRGFPRWAIPYLSILISGIIFLRISYELWGFLATDVKRIIKFSTKTLAVRIQYSALLALIPQSKKSVPNPEEELLLL